MTETKTYKAIVEHHSTGNVAVAGEHIAVHNTSEIPPANQFADGASIRAEIRAIRRLLMEIVSTEDIPAITHRLENAERESTEMKPDKTKIGGWLKTALQLASEGSSFAKALEKIGPNITTVARWLGTEGAQLLKLTGLG